MIRFGLILTLLLALAAPLAHADTPLRNADQLQGLGIDQNLNHQVPIDTPFVDEQGQPATLAGLLDHRPAILVLAYYKCKHLCGFVMSGVAKVVGAMSLKLGKDYNVITVSFNPKDTPEIAREAKAGYMTALGKKANPSGWHFLTGTPPSIKAIADAVGFHYRYIPETGEFAHTAGIMVLTPGGKLSHYFYGIDFPPHDMRLSLVAASSGAIGSAVDKIVLYCCSFDPTTGKYTVMIFRVVQVFCTLLVLCLAGLVLWLTRDRWWSRLSGSGR